MRPNECVVVRIAEFIARSPNINAICLEVVRNFPYSTSIRLVDNIYDPSLFKWET